MRQVFDLPCSLLCLASAATCAEANMISDLLQTLAGTSTRAGISKLLVSFQMVPLILHNPHSGCMFLV